MRFEKLKKEKVISFFSFGIAKRDVRNRYFPNSLFKIECRAIARKIEEVTGLDELGQFLSPELSFQVFKTMDPTLFTSIHGRRMVKT